MTTEIKSVAVLGSGTMGAGIAALCAASGRDVLLLDMPAKEGERNAIAAGAKARMTAGRGALLDDPGDADRVTVGNFDDDLAKLADCDWIVEVVVEDLAIKRGLFARIEAARGNRSIVTTNTSGIPLHAITEGLPARLRRAVAVTHFFNPVKVMKLVEVVPGADTDAAVIAALGGFLSGPLGKGVVDAKDTVNFIANRIGCFWMLAGLNASPAAFADGLAIEDIDAAMSAPVGIPATGLFGLLDLVGLDVVGLVAENLADNLPADDAGRACLNLPGPIAAMLERGQIGRKAGGGFYRMQKTADGGRLKETFDLGTESWRETKVADLSQTHRSLDGLLFAEDALGAFAWRALGGTLAYAADLIPEISDDIVNIDRAMRWGFAWQRGPFEIIDAIGAERVIARIEADGGPLPAMLKTLREAGAERFYRNDGTEYLGTDGTWHPVP